MPLVSTQAVIKFAAKSRHNLHVKDVKLVELRDTWCEATSPPPVAEAEVDEANIDEANSDEAMVDEAPSSAAIAWSGQFGILCNDG